MAKVAGGDAGHAQGSVVGMVLVRAFVGAFFLSAAVSQITDFTPYLRYIHGAVASHGAFIADSMAPAFFTRFLSQTVAPHAHTAVLVVIGVEILVGALLVLGLLTRLGGFLALLLSTAFLLATMHLNGPYLGIHAAFIAMELGIIIAAAGRTLGIDQLLARKSKVKILW